MAEIKGTQTSLVFKVTRQLPELISPAVSTPYEFKELSDIDDQQGLRFHIPIIQFYRNEEHTGGTALRGRDPAIVIKEAVGKALVPYYPFAGRLREKEGRKLVVECTGEGILFIEADANVSLEEFGEPLHPPFPCMEELLFDVPGFSGVLDSPLLLIQVTRLICGGFIMAIRHNHAMADATGLVQFLNAVAELARGALSPSVRPVWERHRLRSRLSPQVTFQHSEYDIAQANKGIGIPLDDLVHKSFFFGPKEMDALWRMVPPRLKSSSKFEVLTACLWRSRTIALDLNPDEIVRIRFTVNARSKFNPPLPTGYYGNAFAFPMTSSTAGELATKPFGYALELVTKNKAKVTEEYMKSLADFLVINGKPRLMKANTFIVSDVTRVGFMRLDFGWGMPAYGGNVTDGFDIVPGFRSCYVPVKTCMEESGIMVPICLPAPAMEKFAKELKGLLRDDPDHPHPAAKSGSSSVISSSL